MHRTRPPHSDAEPHARPQHRTGDGTRPARTWQPAGGAVSAGGPPGLDESVVILTSPTGFLGLELLQRLRGGEATVHHPTSSESLIELARRVRPHMIIHCGVGTLDEVSGELAPRTHPLGEVLEAAERAVVPRVLVTDGLSSPTRPASERTRSKVTFMRLGVVYGPGQDDRRALVPRVIDEFLSGATPTLDSGTGLYDWVYIDDVVNAFVLAATHARPGAVVEVGRGRVSSVADIVTILATATGHPLPVRFGTRPDTFLADRAVLANQTGARRLRWRPSIHPPRGLGLTVTWRREQRERHRGATVAPLQVPRPR